MAITIEAPTNPEDFAPETSEPKVTQLDASGNPIKRRGRPPGSKNRTYGGVAVGSRRSSKESLKTQIGAMITTFNMPLMIVEPTRKYALDVSEIDALAIAIDTECQNNANFRKYVVQMLQVQGASSLVAVVAIIAGRRVVRAGLIPESALAPIGGAEAADAVIGGLLPMVTAKPVPQMTVNVGVNPEA